MAINSKFWVLMLAFLVFLGSLENYGQTFIGVKKGVSLSQVGFSDADPNYNITINQEQFQGDILGLTFKISQSKHTALQFEINIIDKGWKQRLPDETTFNTSLQYLNIYGQTHILIGKGKFKLYLTGGPYINFLIDSENSTIPEDQIENVPFIYNKDSDNKLEFGLGGGGGFSYQSKIGLFQLEGKFSLGLSNIIDKQTANEPLFSRHQTIELSVQYLYQFSKNKDQ